MVGLRPLRAISHYDCNSDANRVALPMLRKRPSPATSAVEQHRDLAVRNHRCGNTSQKKLPNLGSAMSAHDDQITTFLYSKLDNRILSRIS